MHFCRPPFKLSLLVIIFRLPTPPRASPPFAFPLTFPLNQSLTLPFQAIAVHTFVAVWWDKGSSALRVAIGVVTLIWLYVALFVGFGVGLHTHGSYETPTPYWCWVGSNYLPERLAGEYVWLWTTLFVSLLAYLPLFFWARGDISPDGERWWGVNFHGRGKGAMKAAISAEDGKKRLRALYMLAYPAVYCVVVLPLSVVRWITFDGTPVNSAANFVVVSIYNLSGFFNVLLFTLTRPNLLLMRPRAWYASRTGRPPAHNHNNHNHHPPGEELAMDERRRSEAIMPGDEEDEEVDDQGRPTGAGWNIPHSPASSVVSSFFANAATPRKGVVRELTLEAGEGEVLGGGEEYQLSPPTTGRRSNEGYGLSPPPTGRRSNDSRLRRPSNEGGRVSNDHRNPV